jgi:hypothetical protein
MLPGIRAQMADPDIGLRGPEAGAMKSVMRIYNVEAHVFDFAVLIATNPKIVNDLA